MRHPLVEGETLIRFLVGFDSQVAYQETHEKASQVGDLAGSSSLDYITFTFDETIWSIVYSGVV